VGDEDFVIPAPARPASGPARKFGAGVCTPSLLSRLTATVALLTVGAVLSLLMIPAVHRPDSRIAAFVLFLLGLWCLISLLSLPQVWRPSAEWRRQRYEARQLERRLRAAFAPRADRNQSLQALRAPCSVCGQDGPTLVRARAQCTACHRPWLARAS
jgi:hypothetical protein